MKHLTKYLIILLVFLDFTTKSCCVSKINSNIEFDIGKFDINANKFERVKGVILGLDFLTSFKNIKIKKKIISGKIEFDNNNDWANGIVGRPKRIYIYQLHDLSNLKSIVLVDSVMAGKFFKLHVEQINNLIISESIFDFSYSNMLNGGYCQIINPK